MTSIAERRRRRKGRARAKTTLSDGTAVPQVHPNDPKREKPEAANKSALKTRLRIRGIPETPDNMNRAVAPAFGHDVGLCIDAILKGDSAKAAWETFAAMSAAHRNYQMLYVGQTGTPQCAAIAMIPEPMETDPSLRVDLRTHDEKVRAAKASWQAWEKRISALPFPQMKMAINGTLRGFLGDGSLWRDAKPTDTGRTVVAALRAMVA